jgi:hypothetical protein
MKMTGENRMIRRKTCPSVTLFTTNPIWTALGPNSGLRGEKPVSNRLCVRSEGTFEVDLEGTGSGNEEWMELAQNGICIGL